MTNRANTRLNKTAIILLIACLVYSTQIFGEEIDTNKAHVLRSQVTQALLNVKNRQELEQALNLGEMALNHGKKAGNLLLIENATELLYKAYKIRKDFENAADYYEQHIEMTDSIRNKAFEESTTTWSFKQELNNKEKEKVALEKENQYNELVIQQKHNETTRQHLVILFGILALITIAAILVVLIKQYKYKNKTNKELSNKNKQITQQNDIIIESIEYARNLQDTIQVDEHTIQAALSDALIINRPRDIVSGDFYYFANLKGLVIVSLIDCTGHGVPGALTSMIANNFMNSIIKKQGITDPGKVLAEIHKGIIANLRVVEGKKEVNAGMDMGLCCVDSKAGKIHFAGANMYLFRINNGEMDSIKPNKRSIGYSSFFRRRAKSEVIFDTQTIDIEHNTNYYMITDGVVDQFGAHNKEKYGTKKLFDLMKKNCNEPMSKQKEDILASFDSWRGTTRQTDDVSILGFKA